MPREKPMKSSLACLILLAPCLVRAAAPKNAQAAPLVDGSKAGSPAGVVAGSPRARSNPPLLLKLKSDRSEKMKIPGSVKTAGEFLFDPRPSAGGVATVAWGAVAEPAKWLWGGLGNFWEEHKLNRAIKHGKIGQYTDDEGVPLGTPSAAPK